MPSLLRSQLPEDHERPPTGWMDVHGDGCRSGRKLKATTPVLCNERGILGTDATDVQTGTRVRITRQQRERLEQFRM
nr:hypothetical protein CFP56_24003 [Quercus suber]